ncbi:MAG TPA: polyprenyl synthetase family protein [Geobacteraceae bacterium]|nr:polyprenyl synthetase family protein [Geobacteraceae bacterium]
MDEALALIDKDLKNVEMQFLKDLHSNVPLIRKVTEYVFSSGGKRIRPVLLLMSARLCDYRGDRHVPLASVIEFIHTATLLHDDVVDNAQLRRGIASANTLWGNEASVLVGDYLFSKSFSIMIADGDLRILQALSNATTIIAEGEVLQLTSSTDLDITEERYIDVVKSKTAILLATACQAGAILGKAPVAHENALKDFGMNLGIAFQLIDDSLDYTSSEEQFGKSIGHDLEEGKITLPLIHTLKKCTSSERNEIAEIIGKDFLLKDDFGNVFDLVHKYGGIDYTMRVAMEYVDNSKSCLDVFADSAEKNALKALADYVLTRQR